MKQQFRNFITSSFLIILILTAVNPPSTYLLLLLLLYLSLDFLSQVQQDIVQNTGGQNHGPRPAVVAHVQVAEAGEAGLEVGHGLTQDLLVLGQSLVEELLLLSVGPAVWRQNVSTRGEPSLSDDPAARRRRQLTEFVSQSAPWVRVRV